jgi:hypothetical protein
MMAGEGNAKVKVQKAKVLIQKSEFRNRIGDCAKSVFSCLLDPIFK